ncbi:hypothetical protein ACOSQ3_021012 [Xanthoceras sorbifolium]
MGSLPIPNLPVIDLSKENLKPGTSSWLSTCRNVTQALEEYGCFVAMYDGVALELHDAMFSAVEKLFDLPLEIKKKNTSEKPYFGYVGRHQPFIPALYEGMGIDFANTLEGAQNFSSIMWPHGNDSFSNGRIHSAVHRVVMNGSNARYSLGLFTYNEGIIHIPEELADDEHPLQFKPFEHFGLLRYYVTEEGSQAHCTAKAYCGVSNPIQSNKINV